MSADAVVVVPAHAAGTEVHAVRAVRVVRKERTRPVVAAAACVAERTADAVARCGEENRVAVSTCHFVTVYTV